MRRVERPMQGYWKELGDRCETPQGAKEVIAEIRAKRESRDLNLGDRRLLDYARSKLVKLVTQ